ncbi:putative thioredoxin-like fold [Rosellinia necatrix]|uniref:Putative thioredoxin-like fold n=1 Tax=Rosellinia necatrix TaxID=77044 RepID=A0A1W2TGB9_ROSNE|nr:putative thioredoxin-like fold [Rosellinia necatrix]
MFSNLTTKLAMRKAGLSSDALNFSPKPSKPTKDNPAPTDGVGGSDGSGWPAWMSTKNLPLTAQAWLSPAPPPVPVAAGCPGPGDLAPLDRDRQLEFGGGRPVIVLFMRCVGCAFAQKSFLALRTLAAKKQGGGLRCVAVSHSSAAATRKWTDMLGGSWNVEVVVDEDRAIYAAWGLGVGNLWYMFNPTTQVQGWKEKGWLGIKVADAIQRTGEADRLTSAAARDGGSAGVKRTGTGLSTRRQGSRSGGARESEAENEADAAAAGPSTIMGNKWQQTGLFAVDGRGTVVWGTKALRADDTMDLDAAAAALGF